MKRGSILLLNVMFATALLFGTGCGLLSKNKGVVGASTKAETKAQAKVEAIDDAIVSNDQRRLENIAVFSAGADFAMDKVEKPSTEIQIAKELNTRIQSLAGNPSVDDLKSIRDIVNKLTSTIEAEKIKGAEALAAKDEIIADLQLERKELTTSKDSEIKRYMVMAQTTAAKADQYSATIGQMDRWFGMGAIWYGIKKLVTSLSIILGTLGILYLVLRLTANAWPPAAALFSIVDTLASFFIQLIKGLAPGAAKIASLIPTSVHDAYKETLEHIVDTMEFTSKKDKEAVATGQPTPKYTLEEIFNKFAGAMDQKHKDIIDEIKKRLKWS